MVPPPVTCHMRRQSARSFLDTSSAGLPRPGTPVPRDVVRPAAAAMIEDRPRSGGHLVLHSGGRDHTAEVLQGMHKRARPKPGPS